MIVILFLLTIHHVQSSTIAPGIESFLKQTKLTSAYLCYVNPNEFKCCSCKQDCIENCCIDVNWNEHWNQPPATNEETYIKNLIENTEIERERDICHPIIPWFDNTKREHFFMISFYRDQNEKKVSCPSEDFSQMPVYSFHSHRFFISPNCALLNSEFIHFNLNFSVYCEKIIESIHYGKLIQTSDVKSVFSKCIFKLLRNDEMIEIRSCPNEKSYCDKNNMYYDLCRYYRAPTQGYKNKFCYLCDQNSTSKNPELDECNMYTDTTGTEYDQIEIVNFNYPNEYQLIAKHSDSYMIKIIHNKFPVREFLGITDLEVETPMDDILYQRLCSSKGECCSCHADCFKHQFCCMDVLWNETQPISMGFYRNMMIELAQKETQYTCEEYVADDDENAILEKTVFLLVVSTCLPDEVGFHRHHCLATANFFSSIVRTEDGHVFKNKHCARCNRVYKYTSEGISYSLRECSEIHSTKSCKEENPFYKLCHSYFSGLGSYRNMFCFMCMRGSLSTENRVAVRENCRRSIITWSALINFQDNFIESLEFPECLESEILDPVSGYCKPIIKVVNPNLKRCLSQNGYHIFSRYNKSISNSNKFSLAPKVFGNNISLYDENDIHLTYEINVRNESIDGILSKLGMKDDLSAESFMLTSSRHPVFTSLHRVEFLQNFPDDKICYNHRLIENRNLLFTDSCSLMVNDTIYSWSNLSIWITLQGNDDITEHIAICDQYYLNSPCPLKNIHSNVRVYNDGKMTHVDEQGQKFMYDVDEYIPTKEGFGVCSLNGDKENQIWLAVEAAEIYITYIGTTMSLFFYIAVILTFSLVRRLRNTPGLCTLSLTTSLFVSDLSYIVAGILEYTGHNKNFHLCQTIAILMHFGIIAAYVWSVIIASDMMITFAVQLNISTSKGIVKKFCKYSIISYSITILIIICAALLDYLDIATIDYGKNGFCVPSGHTGRLYFYIVPAIVLTVCSTVFLIYALSKIAIDKQTRKVKLRRNGRHDFNVIIVGLKLVFVLGLSEMIGFIQMKKSDQTEADKWFFNIIALLYTTLRSLRGVMLAIVYLCKKDIFQIYLQVTHTIHHFSMTTKKIDVDH